MEKLARLTSPKKGGGKGLTTTKGEKNTQQNGSRKNKKRKKYPQTKYVEREGKKRELRTHLDPSQKRRRVRKKKGKNPSGNKRKRGFFRM